MNMNDDVIVAGADLVKRCGASDFEVGYLRDDVPSEQAGWYAHAQWRGARITVEERRSPGEAMMALAERLLDGATCRCGLLVTLSDDRPGCRWTLNGKRWEPGCDAEPVHVSGRRGDTAAQQAAVEQRRQQAQQPNNRAERRATKRRRK